MNNPKADAQLNQALNATNEERSRSLELNVGYNEVTQQWDLIIKHTGSPDSLRPYVVVIYRNLFAENRIKNETSKSSKCLEVFV